MALEYTLDVQWVDILSGRIAPRRLGLAQGRIVSMEALPPDAPTRPGYYLPGFVDAHVHIESSMLAPAAFAQAAVCHGTVGTVSDPHEIANVLGLSGVRYMLENGKQVPFHFAWGAPSCVPATDFETAGASLSLAEIHELLSTGACTYLSEMMNFPGVIHQDPAVWAKIACARALGLPVDGHAPGLRGEALDAYLLPGIDTDHECFTAAEAEEKLQKGVKILIREGSAAKNFEVLQPLIARWWSRMMFCSDDKHPDNLLEGHINQLCARAVAAGHDLFQVLTMACLNPVDHYRMGIGRGRVGDSADFIAVEDLSQFRCLETWIAGHCVYSEGQSRITLPPTELPNQFVAQTFDASDLLPRSSRPSASQSRVRTIVAEEGQLVTQAGEAQVAVRNGYLYPDPSQDVLLLAVVNRYQAAAPAVAFVQGFGLKEGALASSVAHDSHNVVAVGASPEALAEAISAVMQSQGGIAVAGAGPTRVLPLPIAGLMSDLSCAEVAESYTQLDQAAKALGSALSAPFMTLSFMALLVIPALKLSDKGLFDGQSFAFCPLELGE